MFDCLFRAIPPHMAQVNASEYTKMPHFHWMVDKPTNKDYSCFNFKKDGRTSFYLSRELAG